MEWFYAKDGTQEGPIDSATLQAKLQSGEVRPTDLVWKEGMAEWTAAGKVPELSGTGAAPAGSSQSAQPAAPGSLSESSQAPIAHEPIPNYLVWSILVTILCCWPFGIPAIVYAAKVDGMVARGDIDGARDASDKAKMWMWISFGVGLLAILAYAGLMVSGFLSNQ